MTEPKVLSERYEVRTLLGRGGMAEVHEAPKPETSTT